MYMGPITAVAVRQPASPLLRRVAGVPVLLVAAPVMLAWLGTQAMVAGVVLGARGVAAAPRFALTALDYAGGIALGR